MLCLWLTNKGLKSVGKAQTKPRNQQDIQEDISKGDGFGFVFHL